jgi:hypothetical protein
MLNSIEDFLNQKLDEKLREIKQQNGISPLQKLDLDEKEFLTDYHEVIPVIISMINKNCIQNYEQFSLIQEELLRSKNEKCKIPKVRKKSNYLNEMRKTCV